MATPEQEYLMRGLAEGLGEALEKMYGQEMAFFLCVSPYGKDTIADYISNGKREDSIKWLRETADRLEANQDIPTTKGNA